MSSHLQDLITNGTEGQTFRKGRQFVNDGLASLDRMMEENFNLKLSLSIVVFSILAAILLIMVIYFYFYLYLIYIFLELIELRVIKRVIINY